MHLTRTEGGAFQAAKTYPTLTPPSERIPKLPLSVHSASREALEQGQRPKLADGKYPGVDRDGRYESSNGGSNQLVTGRVQPHDLVYSADGIGYSADGIGYSADGIGYSADGIGYSADGIGYSETFDGYSEDSVRHTFENGGQRQLNGRQRAVNGGQRQVNGDHSDDRIDLEETNERALSQGGTYRNGVDEFVRIDEGEIGENADNVHADRHLSEGNRDIFVDLVPRKRGFWAAISR